MYIISGTTDFHYQKIMSVITLTIWDITVRVILTHKNISYTIYRCTYFLSPNQILHIYIQLCISSVTAIKHYSKYGLCTVSMLLSILQILTLQMLHIFLRPVSRNKFSSYVTLHSHYICYTDSTQLQSTKKRKQTK